LKHALEQRPLEIVEPLGSDDDAAGRVGSQAALIEQACELVEGVRVANDRVGPTGVEALEKAQHGSLAQLESADHLATVELLVEPVFAPAPPGSLP
jgi:hypothetical protein